MYLTTNCVVKMDVLESSWIIYFTPSSGEESCPENQFTCKNKRCIGILRTCDGINDCGDHSDEIYPCSGKIKKFQISLFLSVTWILST